MPSNLFLKGKHVVVTGGGRGIGAAIAAELDRHGATITVMGRNKDILDVEVKRLQAGKAVVCDVTSAASVEEAFRSAADRARIDILVNNAGAVSSAPFSHTNDNAIAAMLEVNLTGPMRCTRAVLPGMKAAGWGRIVNVASTAGLKGYPYVSAYCAAKHGVIGFTRALALELARSGITVNAVCPGYTDTDLVAGAVETIVNKTKRPPAEVLAELTQANPMGRLIGPKEVAGTVAWLCGAESGSITGQAIAIAGGEVM